jgi:hypothetical protein
MELRAEPAEPLLTLFKSGIRTLFSTGGTVSWNPEVASLSLLVGVLRVDRLEELKGLHRRVPAQKEPLQYVLLQIQALQMYSSWFGLSNLSSYRRRLWTILFSW